MNSTIVWVASPAHESYHPEAAALDLEETFHWISKDNPRAAIEMVERIRLRINRLALPGLSHIGRPGSVEGTRELVEPPFIIVYTVDEKADEIDVLAVMHGARNREKEK